MRGVGQGGGAAPPCQGAKAARTLAGERERKRNREQSTFFHFFLAKSSRLARGDWRGADEKLRTVSTSRSKPSWFSTPCGTYMHVSSPGTLHVCVKRRNGGEDVGFQCHTRHKTHTRAHASARAVPLSLSLSNVGGGKCAHFGTSVRRGMLHCLLDSFTRRGSAE